MLKPCFSFACVVPTDKFGTIRWSQNFENKQIKLNTVYYENLQLNNFFNGFYHLLVAILESKDCLFIDYRDCFKCRV